MKTDEKTETIDDTLLTDENLQKALDSLGINDLKTDESENDIEKAKNTKKAESEENASTSKVENTGKEGYVPDEETNGGEEEEMSDEKEEGGKNTKKVKPSTETPAMEKTGYPEMKKSIDDLTDINNKIKESVESVPDLIKGEIEGFIQSVDEKFKAVGELNKAIISQNDDLKNRIEELESMPIGRKSAPTSKAIEKSFDSGDEGTGVEKVLQSGSNRKEIIGVLNDKIEKANSDSKPVYENALLQFEASNIVPDLVKAKILEEDKTLIK